MTPWLMITPNEYKATRRWQSRAYDISLQRGNWSLKSHLHAPISRYLDGTEGISLFAERHGGEAPQVRRDVLLKYVLWGLADERGQESV